MTEQDKIAAAAERAAMTSAIDYEITAMKRAFLELKDLELDALRRVLEWLENRLIHDAKRRQYEESGVPF